MITDWKLAEDALKQIEVRGNNKNELVEIMASADGLQCIGIGTDAAVFRYDRTPDYAYKVYSHEAAVKKEIEENVYRRLNGVGYFPRYYGKGDNYIVLSLEQGVTLYDCLIRGIAIPRKAILDVEEAREYARLQGLNPRDIHLKNVLLQNGRGKVIDVSEYVMEGNDRRWEHLLWAYNHIYPLIEGVKIPAWLLEFTKTGYNWIQKAAFVWRRNPNTRP
ncbi:serine/threonine protein kinase [Paenibacillus tarimensis]